MSIEEGMALPWDLLLELARSFIESLSATDTYNNFRSAGFYSAIGGAVGNKAWTSTKTSVLSPTQNIQPYGLPNA